MRTGRPTLPILLSPFVFFHLRVTRGIQVIHSHQIASVPSC